MISIEQINFLHNVSHLNLGILIFLPLKLIIYANILQFSQTKYFSYKVNT